MPNHRTILLTLVLGSALLAGSPASALTLCVGPCDTGAPPGPITVIAPSDLPVIDADGITGIVLGPDSPGIPIVATGSVIVHVPSGTLEAASIDWRAGGDIDLSEPIFIDVGAGSISLGSNVGNPFGGAGPVFDADPFHITVVGPLSGAFELEAGGSIIVTQAPVPEPGTAMLIGVGVALVAMRSRHRVR